MSRPLAIVPLTALARATAMFFGGLGLLNALRAAVTGGIDLNIWWIDLRAWPDPAGRAFIITASLLLIGYAVRPRMGAVRRHLTLACVVVVLLVASSNAMTFFKLRAAGVIDTPVWLPLSLPIACLFGAVAWEAAARGRGSIIRSRQHNATWLSAAFVMLLIPSYALAQMHFFGNTSYRRPADATVVFGARAYADGTPSLALADRVKTASDLYHQGLTRRLVFSGGPGDGRAHETEVMRDHAMALGVPGDAIDLDPNGLNTAATVRNTMHLFDMPASSRVMVVSHDYHLPRVKMAYQRAGREVYTVPAAETRPLLARHWYMAREVAAYWAYFLGVR